MKTDKEIITYSPRQAGKNIEAILRFLFEGKKGKSVVFATLQGNFLSPKAVENALKEQREKLVREIEGMKEKNKNHPLQMMMDGEINDTVDVSLSYEMALDNVLNFLKK